MPGVSLVFRAEIIHVKLISLLAMSILGSLKICVKIRPGALFQSSFKLLISFYQRDVAGWLMLADPN